MNVDTDKIVVSDRGPYPPRAILVQLTEEEAALFLDGRGCDLELDFPPGMSYMVWFPPDGAREALPEIQEIIDSHEASHCCATAIFWRRLQVALVAGLEAIQTLERSAVACHN